MANTYATSSLGGTPVSRRAVVLALAGLAATAAVMPASAAPTRTDTQVYIAAGGASAGAITAYASSSQRPVADNVGLVRSNSVKGEKSVIIRVQDGSGSPVAARVEGYRDGAGFVLVSCNASKVAAIRLKGVTELRVTPLAGLCAAAGTPNTMSLPTSGEVLFTFTR